MIENIRYIPFSNSKFLTPKRMCYIQNGVEKQWDLVEAMGSVAIFLFDQERQKIVMVKQFRPPVYAHNGDGYTYELCAGLLDKAHLDPYMTAKEEILEECGYDVPVESIHHITSFHTAVGLSGAEQMLFYAEVNNTMCTHQGGGVEDESIEVIEFGYEEIDTFINDKSRVTTPGVLYSLMWFRENYLN